MRLPYDDSVKQFVTNEHYKERYSLIASLLDNPCLAWYNSLLRCYLLTEFLSHGFGYTLCQPDSDNAYQATMARKVAGGDCDFFQPKSNLRLCPVSFGSCHTRGNEKGSTCTLARPSRVIGPLIRITIDYGPPASLGSSIATSSVLCYLMTALTPSSYTLVSGYRPSKGRLVGLARLSQPLWR